MSNKIESKNACQERIKIDMRSRHFAILRISFQSFENPFIEIDDDQIAQKIFKKN